MEKFKSRKDKVLLTTKFEQKTKGGLILTDGDKSKNIAIVVAVPDGIEDLKKDDKVVYNPFTANPVEIDGQEFIIVKDESIYGVLED